MSNVKDIKGITDVVSRYTFVDMEYPCLCLKDKIQLPKHKWEAISKLSKSGSENKNIALYLFRDDNIYKLGYLSGLQIKYFIDLVGLDNIVGFHSKNKELEGVKIYVLAHK